MPAKDDWNVHWRPNAKARCYLQRLGFIDGRTGRKKSEALNLNEFLNHAAVGLLESHKRPGQDAVSDAQLTRAWIEAQRALVLRRINQDSATLRELNAQLDKLEEAEKHD